jgi:hypothetical protein
MRCKEAKKILVAYLDGEVMPSERTLLEAHLAGCGRCERELATLGAGRRQVGDSLKTMAGQVSPCPDALARLQTALAHDSRVRAERQGERGMKLRWKIAVATVGTLALAAAVVVSVPATRAAAGDFFAGVFHLELKPLELTYLPEGFEPMPAYQTGSVQVVQPDDTAGNGNATAPQVAEEQERSLYQSGDLFVLVTTYKGSQQSLPDGEPATVNGLAAILQTGLSGTVGAPVPPAIPAGAGTAGASIAAGVASLTVSGGTAGPQGPAIESGTIEGGETRPRVIPSLDYQNAGKLTWLVDGTRVEVLSNLPLAELLRVAEGLVLDN